jgi:alkyl sulfatase BDS1-like metallo-beta-lactamase superfamily hydrolase
MSSRPDSEATRLLLEVHDPEEPAADPTRRFFAGLAERHEPLPRALSGLIRIDVKDADRTERYFVQFREGDVAVSREGVDADCLLVGDRSTFDAVVTGRMNVIDALLRKQLDVQGDAIFLTALQRLFPSSPGIDSLLTAGGADRES